MGRLRTADGIEELKSVRAPNGTPKASRRGKSPNSRRNLVAPWSKGTSGNPGGRPKDDVAREIAQAVFRENADAIYDAMTKALLKGNAYVFKELAERAFGKMKESHVHEFGRLDQLTDEQLVQLATRLGISTDDVAAVRSDD